MVNSTHKVEVIRLDKIDPHPDADRLDIVTIFGYTTCPEKDAFHVGDLAAFIPPDSVVPATEQFAFLDGHNRIKVKKLRGIISYGFLVPAPEGAQEGDDVAELMGITHYEPHVSIDMGGANVAAPAGWHPVYDVDALLRYPNVFQPGELVCITEKIHGMNARFTCVDGEMYCGSHNHWRADAPGSSFWRVLRENPCIEEFCRANEGKTLYGEIYGSVQKLTYGCAPGELRFAAFDILDHTAWLGVADFRRLAAVYDIPTVPLLFVGEYDQEFIARLADGNTTIEGAKHVREGVVVRPMVERRDQHVGRVCLKFVSPKYLEKDKG